MAALEAKGRTYYSDRYACAYLETKDTVVWYLNENGAGSPPAAAALLRRILLLSLHPQRYSASPRKLSFQIRTEKTALLFSKAVFFYSITGTFAYRR